MEKAFKHPQIFSDLLMFYKRYYPIHAGLPKPFRFTTGEGILSEITSCLKQVTPPVGRRCLSATVGRPCGCRAGDHLSCVDAV